MPCLLYTSYWLVKQGRFKVILVGGKMRIMLDSFEEWYGRQFRYKKVNGPEPGQLLPASLTIPEAADILGLNPGSVYELIKNHAPLDVYKRQLPSFTPHLPCMNPLL